jgi:uncharacterized protein YigE (DUF2233 family)
MSPGDIDSAKDSNGIPSNKTVEQEGWKKIDEGLFLCDFNSPVKSEKGDSKITVLKIDPAYYIFRLLCAKEKKCENKTAKEWAAENKLVAVINAGMFREDEKTSTGFMKNYDFINNGKLGSDNSIVAFNRKDKSVPEFQIIDRECEDFEKLKDHYNTFSQGIRMIDCNRNNKWEQQDKKWSTVCIGEDKQGNALFIFSRSPYSVHDFIEILLKLPIEIQNTQYLEGGPEASFYLHYDKTEIEKFGSFETGFNENNDNSVAWPLPNVIGISKK